MRMVSKRVGDFMVIPSMAKGKGAQRHRKDRHHRADAMIMLSAWVAGWCRNPLAR